MNFKHGNDSDEHSCEMCDYKTNDKASLRKHINFKHGNASENHSCELCDYKANDKSLLRKHMTFKHGNDSDDHMCHFCDYKATDKAFLRKHMNVEHDTENNNVRSSRECHSADTSHSMPGGRGCNCDMFEDPASWFLSVSTRVLQLNLVFVACWSMPWS